MATPSKSSAFAIAKKLIAKNKQITGRSSTDHLEDLFREPAMPLGDISPHSKAMNHPGPSDELLMLLEHLPPDEPRSKLEPFRAIILRNQQHPDSFHGRALANLAVAIAQPR
jgi:hypothetical protein